MNPGGSPNDPTLGALAATFDPSSLSSAQPSTIDPRAEVGPLAPAPWERQPSSLTARPVVPVGWLRRMPGGGTVFAPPADEPAPEG